MRAAALVLGCLVSIACTSSAHAGATIGTWTSNTATTAIGDVNGIGITATTTGSTSFLGIGTGRLVAPVWQAGMDLSSTAQTLTTLNVNAGDAQQFDFDSAFTGLLYIENFDSSSMANVNSNGIVSFVAGSSSISYAGGVLGTSNASFNGEGDAILRLEGVTSISLNYTAGTGNNGVFYAFVHDPAAVPEPASVAIWAAFLGIGVVVMRRQKKN